LADTRQPQPAGQADRAPTDEPRPATARSRRSRAVAAFFALAQVVGFVSSLHALMSVRTPQGTVAWVVSLNTLPAVAVPIYWVFGRSNFRGYVVLRQEEDSDLRGVTEQAAETLQPFRAALSRDHGRIQAAERLAKMPFLVGNNVELLVNGQATFDSLFAGIEQARDFILVQFYIVKDDQLGRRLKSALLRKAAEGVRVYFLYDEVGSYKLPASYSRELRDGGVDVREFHSTRGAGNRFQLNFRNHRKVVVVDGATGWVGGHNVGDEYIHGTDKLGPWRDTHVKIDGPAVLGLQLSFLEDWNWATDRILELDWTPRPAAAGDAAVLVLPTGPADKLETASLMFQHAIHSAEQRIWIASPYFVPDEGVLGALQLARLRGVDVRVLIPDNPDHLLVYMSAYAFVGRMLESGIGIHRYEPGFLHQKVFVIDDHVAAVGTTNLDNRSFRLNFEITALIADRDFTSQVAEMLADDFRNSRRMTVAELDAKSFWFKLAARAAYLTAPIQ